MIDDICRRRYISSLCRLSKSSISDYLKRKIMSPGLQRTKTNRHSGFIYEYVPRNLIPDTLLRNLRSTCHNILIIYFTHLERKYLSSTTPKTENMVQKYFYFTKVRNLFKIQSSICIELMSKREKICVFKTKFYYYYQKILSIVFSKPTVSFFFFDT